MNQELRIKKIILSIDTSKREEAVVGLEIGGEKFEKRVDTLKAKSQVLLLVIDELLREHNLTKENLTDIHVNRGPGSFTGVRVGVSIANTLSWALQIPINGQKKLVEPLYAESKFDTVSELA